MSKGKGTKANGVRQIECLRCQARFLSKSEKERYCSKCKHFLEEIWRGERFSDPLDMQRTAQ